ncbi:threonyl-tRNA synthetase editing domain-containing protein [Thioalkalivibrio sp. HK1]|uniref:threonyl-tRNA synthetase editing domain-containing protein n=1 Tax=Thioalkalivibrio sp. HK1 TaxID=1469245 RepID=UPI00047228BA|nr:threonyl-tRNA synthetase editing domain-containing protein [Thioalkalivibrio sp. HK1]
MKLLMFHAERFGYRAQGADGSNAAHRADSLGASVSEPSLRRIESSSLTGRVESAILVLVQVESGDIDRQERLVAKATRNVKWFASKRSLDHVVLHSFAHLGGESSSPDAAREILGRLAGRLESKGFSVSLTPFGRSFALDIAIHEDPGAKVFKSI